MFRPLLIFIAVCLGAAGVRADTVREVEVCVYGGTSGGAIAAVQAARHGKSVALAVFGNHVGGMTAGGLGATDVGGNGNAYIGGVALEFYQRIGAKYKSSAAKYSGFEPHVAETVYGEMLTEAGVAVRHGQRLLSVTKDGQRIRQITMEDGTIYRAGMFIDASYEGDLMAMAGVTWTIGRESSATYGESLNGTRTGAAGHQFSVNVDPYVTPGNPASGLLPFMGTGSIGVAGQADARVQAYNYRLCLTTVAANRLAIAAPAGYSEAQYELLGRLIDARVAKGDALSMTSFMNVGSVSNSKTDINNNGAFSTDLIGMSDGYALASYTQRAVLEQAHRDYIQGFLYYLGHSTRVPATVRNTVLTYGWCADEFTDRGGFGELYVREARRMVSDYVMLQGNCQGNRVAADPIGEGSYTMDAHNAQRVVQNGFAKNEGDVQSGSGIYGISYRSIVPRVGECENLLVPWALSASHIGFGSIRMEPVFMILAQSAGTAAAFALDDGVAVQGLSYPRLALGLLAGKQVLPTTASTVGTIVDNADSSGVTITGAWTASSSTTGYWGSDYLHDGAADKSGKSVRFTPTLPAAGDYEVYLRWTSASNRSANVPVDLVTPAGTSTITVDERSGGGAWSLLGTATFPAGVSGSVLVRAAGTTDGTYVVADAARWVPVGALLPSVQIVAEDAVTREGTADSARVVLVRSAADATEALTVKYGLSGTADTSDIAALPGSVTFAAGATTAAVSIQALGDALAEGVETLTLTILPDAAYHAGVLDSATVYLLDRPVDAWRHARFTAAELTNANISGDAADPDGDGLTNLQEDVLGLNPRGRETAAPVTLAYAGGALTLTYTQARSATDVTLIPEGTYDLVNWGTTGIVEEIARLDEGSNQRVTVRLIPSAAAPGKGYLRLRITR